MMNQYFMAATSQMPFLPTKAASNTTLAENKRKTPSSRQKIVSIFHKKKDQWNDFGMF